MGPKRRREDSVFNPRKYIVNTTQKCIPGWLQGLQLNLPVPQEVRSALATHNVVVFPTKTELNLLRVLQMTRGYLEEDMIELLKQFVDCSPDVFGCSEDIQEFIKNENKYLREMANRYYLIYARRLQLRTAVENTQTAVYLTGSHIELLRGLCTFLPYKTPTEQYHMICDVSTVLDNINQQFHDIAEYDFGDILQQLLHLYSECLSPQGINQLRAHLSSANLLGFEEDIEMAWDNCMIHAGAWTEMRSKVIDTVPRDWPEEFARHVRRRVFRDRAKLIRDLSLWMGLCDALTIMVDACLLSLQNSDDFSIDYHFDVAFTDIKKKITNRLKNTGDLYASLEKHVSCNQKITEKDMRHVIETNLLRLIFVVNDKCLREELDTVIKAWQSDHGSVLIIYANSPIRDAILETLAKFVSNTKKIIFFGPNVPQWTSTITFTCSESKLTFGEFDSHSQDYILGLPIPVYKMKFHLREIISKTDSGLEITNDALKEIIVRTELNSPPVLEWLQHHFSRNLPLYKSNFMSDPRSPSIMFHAFVMARNSPLHVNAMIAKKTAVTSLIDEGHDVNALDLAGRTPLHLASLSADDDRHFIVAKIANSKPNINVRDKVCNLTPLEYFDVCIGHYDNEYDWKCLEMLVAEEEVSIFSAAFYNLPFSLKRLLDKHNKGKKDKQFINMLDPQGNTVGHVAIYGGSDSCFKIVLENGLDVNIPNVNGDSVLYAAAECGRVAAVDLLLKLQPKIDLSAGKSALHIAVRNNYGDVVTMLLDFGADVNELRSCESFRDVAVVLAKRPPSADGESGASGSPGKSKKTVVERKPQSALRRTYNATPLHVACLRGHEKLMRLLLDRGARVDATDSNGNTALHLAANAGRVPLAQLLLSRGASLSARNADGELPVDMARRNNNSLAIILRQCENKMFPSFC